MSETEVIRNASKIQVIRHVSGEVFAFVDCDYENSVGVLMKSRGWTHHDVTWIAWDFYAVTWRENLEHWSLEAVKADPTWPRPIGIEGAGFMKPQPVHCCSVTASQYIEIVEYRAVWSDEARARADFDEIDEFWFSELLAVERDINVRDYRDTVDDCSRPKKEAFTGISGPYYFSIEEHGTEEEAAEAMRELCQSNPPL